MIVLALDEATASQLSLVDTVMVMFYITYFVGRDTKLRSKITGTTLRGIP